MIKYQSAEGYLYLNSTVTVKKLHPNAELPFKENQFDAAWELSVISRDENRVEDVLQDVNVFNTGISVSGPKNYHFEVIEHPQLYKAGYSLVGGPRIVNPEDDSEIQVPLMKFKECEDLELPYRAALLILRQTEHITIAAETIPQNKKSTTNLVVESSDQKKKSTRSKRKTNIF